MPTYEEVSAVKINGNQVRKGTLLLIEGGLWRVTKTEATKTGKSGAYNQVEMKNITTGTKKNTRFRASETVERARVEERKMTFLYESDNGVVLMDPNTFDQIDVPSDVIGDDVVFLDDGMEVGVEFHEEDPLNIVLPAQVTLTIVETEPALKGQTVSSSFKPAVASNGLRVMVPQFINVDDEIVVETEERSYVKRAEK